MGVLESGVPVDVDTDGVFRRIEFAVARLVQVGRRRSKGARDAEARAAEEQARQEDGPLPQVVPVHISFFYLAPGHFVAERLLPGRRARSEWKKLGVPPTTEGKLG